MATLAPPPLTRPRPALRTAEEERAARVRFRRAIALLVMTLVLPGSAQLVAGNKEVGRTALRIWFVLLVGGVGTALTAGLWHQLAFWIVSTPWLLLVVRLLLIALALGWAALFVDAWRIGQPLSLMLNHRRVIIAISAVMALGVGSTLLFGAHMVSTQRGLVLALFSGNEVTGAHDGRFNVLLLGGDAGQGRWGLRPDSITVASIDARTGRTVLVGLPRNMANFPFAKGSVMREQFPGGFDCEGCYLNGVSTWAEDHKELFGDSEHPGVDATIDAVEGITDLKINYWAMVNLEGFKDLVDAVGGVTLNVRDRIPVGLPSDDFYTHIEPGVKKLDGFETLWFARARYDSDDYSRMARQKCVMSAMLHQLSPQTVLTNFSAIAKASSAMVSTNVPHSELDYFIDLALKAKSQKISTVSLVPPAVDTADPDIAEVHAMVAAAIDKASGEPKDGKPAQQAPTADVEASADADADADAGGGARAGGGTSAEPATPDVVTGGSIGSLKTGYAANQAEDLGAVC